MKRQLTFGFEETFGKKWVKRLSDKHKEAIRLALKEIMVDYFKMGHTCCSVSTEAEEKSAKELSVLFCHKGHVRKQTNREGHG